MEKSFIEVYDDVIPDDICGYLISLFEKENNHQSDTIGRIYIVHPK